MTSIWSFPTRVIFGQGAAQELGSEAKRLGAKHALLVSDPGVAGAGILDGISESLQAAGLGVTRYTDVSGNPLEAEVLGGLEPGDVVVLYPSELLADGSEVEAR